MRFILLTILNISLPFIIREIYIFTLRILHKKKSAKTVIDVTPPTRQLSTLKMIFIGLLLLAISLIGYRILGVEIDTPFTGNQARSEKF